MNTFLAGVGAGLIAALVLICVTVKFALEKLHVIVQTAKDDDGPDGDEGRAEEPSPEPTNRVFLN